MGGVTNIEISGDNDPEIFPTKYFNHYLYCDHCGSFDLIGLIEPSNYQQLESIEKWLYYITGAFIAISLFWMLIDLSIDWFLILSIILLVMGSFFFGKWVSSKIVNDGVLCQSCDTHFQPDSLFFKTYEDNPRNLTMSDVPKPLYKNYQIKGENLDS